MSRSEWEPVAGDTRGSVTALAPAAANVVFATTPVGVHRSADAGRTWQLSGTETGVAFGETIAVSSEDVFVGAPDGLHRSTDGGRSWQRVLAGSRVAAVTASAGVVLAGTDTDGVLRSEDAGVHWSGVNAGLLDLEVLALCLSPSFASERLAFVGTPSGLYRSRNGGDSWRAVDVGLDDPAVQCLAMGPDRLVVAGTEADGLVCSDDGGTSWQQPVELAERSVTAVAISAAGPIAAATDSGLFTSVDRGQTWRLQTDEPQAVLALLYLEDTTLLAGAERTGAWRLEGTTWSESSSGLHASLLSTLAVGPDDSLWAAGPTEAVRVWRAGAWHKCSIVPPEATVLGLSVAADGAVFTATPEGVYVSRGGSCELAYAGPIRAVSGSKRIVAVTQDILTSEDLGTTWRTLSTPFEAASVIAIAAGAAALVFATRDASQTVLWRSDDGGAHWQRTVLDATLTALAVAPDGDVWLATTTGLRVSRDQGKTFKPTNGPQRVIAMAPPYALELGGQLWRRRDSG